MSTFFIFCKKFFDPNLLNQFFPEASGMKFVRKAISLEYCLNTLPAIAEIGPSEGLDAAVQRTTLYTLKLSKNTNGIQNIFSYFPFREMINNSPDTVSLLLDILEYFLEDSKFLQNTNNALCYTIEFTLTNISHFARKGNYELLLKLIVFLCELFSRTKFMLSAISLEIDIDRICELILLLIQITTLRYDLALLLTEILDMREIVFTKYELVDYCISTFFTYLEPGCKELSILAVAALRASPRLTLSNANGLIFWLYEKCPLLLDEGTTEVKLNILECIVLALEARYNIKKEFKLINVYKSKITSLYRLLSNRYFFGNIIKIFCYIINDFVSAGVLPAMDKKLVEEVDSVIAMKSNPMLTSEILLIIDYLQYLHSPHEIDKEKVQLSIMERCLSNAYYPTIILKALCLLLPTLFGNRAIIRIENNVLDAVERCKHLSQIITYHPIQLHWFLESSRSNLKTIILEMWLMNNNENKTIVNALRKTDTIELLVPCLLIKFNEKIPRRAAHLLSELGCPRTSILVKRQLPTSAKSECSLRYHLKAKPALPDVTNEGLFFCTMMSTILPVLTEKDAFIEVCSYSFRLLTKFKKDAWATKEFILNETCVSRLCETASNIDDELALNAITFLVIFIKLQKRHSIKISRSTPIDFRKLLKGPPSRLLKSILLLDLILTYPGCKFLISMRRDDTMGVYQHLQQFECPDIYPQIFRIFIKLHNTYPFLVHLQTTKIYVEMHCVKVFKTGNQIEHFIFFLTDWLEVMSEICTNLLEVSESIRSFLREQPYSEQIGLLTKLLNKCTG